MDKILYALMLLNTAFLGSVTAQSIAVIDPPATVTGYANQAFSATFGVKNQSDLTVNVKVKRFILEEVSGSLNNICWGVACYPPDTEDTPEGMLINPDAVENSFKGDYYPEGNAGTTIIKYCFYNDDEPEDSTCVNITFEAAPAGVATHRNEQDLFVFPSPATDMISITSPSLAGHLGMVEIIDITGKVLKSQKVNNALGQTEMSVKDMVNGIYFCRIAIDGQSIATKKIAVISGR